MGIFSSSASSVRKLFKDTFNRGDQSGIGTASDGTQWDILNGSFSISSNKLSASTGTAYPLAAVDFPDSDVNIALSGVSQGVSTALWVTDSGNWWAVGIDQVVDNQCNCDTCHDCIATDGGTCAAYNTIGYTCSSYTTINYSLNGYNTVNYATGNYNTINSWCVTYSNNGGSAVYSYAGGNAVYINGGGSSVYTNSGGSAVYSNSGGSAVYNTVNSSCSAYNTRNCIVYNGSNCSAYNSGSCRAWITSTICSAYNTRTCRAYNTSNCAAYGESCRAYSNAGGTLARYNTVNSTLNGYNTVNSTLNGYNTVTSGVDYYNTVYSTLNSYNTIGSTCNATTSGGNNIANYVYADGGNGIYSYLSGGDCVPQYASGGSCSGTVYNTINCTTWNSYSCNCQTCYPQYVRVFKSVGSVVSEVTSWLVSSAVGSFRVKTSGEQITTQVYSDPDLVTQIGSDLVYTPTNVSFTNRFGITLKSSENQGTTVDEINISRN